MIPSSPFYLEVSRIKKKKVVQKHYTDAFKDNAVAYYLREGLAATMKNFNLPEATLRRWIKNRSDALRPMFEAEQEAERQTMADYLESRRERVCEILDKILNALMDDERIASATYSQLTTAFGTLVDKYSGIKTEDTSENGGVVVLPEVEYDGDMEATT